MHDDLASPQLLPLRAVFTRRLSEINVGLASAPRPRLVSTPTTVAG